MVLEITVSGGTSPTTQLIVLVASGLILTIISSLGGYVLARNRKMYKDDETQRRDLREIKDILGGKELTDLEKRAGIVKEPGMVEVLNTLARAFAQSGLTEGASDGPFVRENGPAMRAVRERLGAIEMKVGIPVGSMPK